MTKPNECKWCGCGCGLVDETTNDELFACGSSHRFFSDTWYQSKGCMEIMQSRKRIKKAVEVLEKGERFVDYTVSGEALEILRGEVPETPDSSPVTADQLATADYFEAVRQRVPWMVSVEHIEGLVEGYRQCGVMVWRAAEQIKLIFGGGNGQTD